MAVVSPYTYLENQKMLQRMKKKNEPFAAALQPAPVLAVQPVTRFTLFPNFPPEVPFSPPTAPQVTIIKPLNKKYSPRAEILLGKLADMDFISDMDVCCVRKQPGCRIPYHPKICWSSSKICVQHGSAGADAHQSRSTGGRLKSISPDGKRSPRRCLRYSPWYDLRQLGERHHCFESIAVL